MGILRTGPKFKFVRSNSNMDIQQIVYIFYRTCQQITPIVDTSRFTIDQMKHTNCLFY